ncbi:hypothetical protein Tco_0132738 [Tanacetum coccineum]
MVADGGGMVADGGGMVADDGGMVAEEEWWLGLVGSGCYDGMADARKFRSLVRRVIYLTHTRPDLTYVVGIVYRKEKFELVCYSESDWAGEKEDMKSTSRNSFTLGSGLISLASKKQATVALSSTEAVTKHIAKKYHFIRELVVEGEVDLEFWRTDKQIADLFTKSLSRGKFEEF